MRRYFISLIVLFLTLAGCASGVKTTTQNVAKQGGMNQGRGTLVIQPVLFNKDAYIREAVKKECNLDGKLVHFLEQYASNQYATINTDTTTAQSGDQVLKIEIEQVQGSAGGAWSGGKMVLINGKLTQDGQLLGDFKGRRYSGGGMFGGYKGTCAILGRCVRALGKDVAQWLANPVSNAVLGDL